MQQKDNGSEGRRQEIKKGLARKLEWGREKRERKMEGTRKKERNGKQGRQRERERKKR